MTTLATAPGDPNFLYEAITMLRVFVENDEPIEWTERGVPLSYDQAEAVYAVLPALLVEKAKVWSEGR